MEFLEDAVQVGAARGQAPRRGDAVVRGICYSVCIYIYTHIQTCSYVHVYIHIYTMCLSMCVLLHSMSMCAYMYTCIYVYR